MKSDRPQTEPKPPIRFLRKALRGPLLIAVAAVLISPIAASQEMDLAPRIDHTPVTRTLRGRAVPVRAIIKSPMGKPIFEPYLFVRFGGFSEWVKIPLKLDPSTPEMFVADVSGEHVESGFDYYLEAFDEDGNGPARVGTIEKPFHVTVVDELPPEVLTASNSAPRSASYSHAPTFTLFGVSVLSGIVGGGFGIASNQAKGNYLSSNRYGDFQRAQSNATVANVLFAAAGALAASALGYEFWPLRPTSAKADQPLAPAPVKDLRDE